MKRAAQFVVLTSVLWLVFPAWPATLRYAVTTATVAEALNRAGARVEERDVVLMANVVASTPNPLLRLRSFEEKDGHSVVARFDCESTHECLPFLVTVLVDSRATAVKTKTPLLPRISPLNSPVLFRAGSTTTLQLDGEHVHITLPVICLENGIQGKIIRVTDRNRRMVYRAEVVNDGLLKARLQ